jgi:hypothetical protein
MTMLMPPWKLRKLYKHWGGEVNVPVNSCSNDVTRSRSLGTLSMGCMGFSLTAGYAGSMSSVDHVRWVGREIYPSRGVR